MLQRSISYGVCLLRACGTAVYWRVAVPTKRCSRPQVPNPGARRSMAQQGGRAADATKASAQHGATRRAQHDDAWG